MLSPSVIKNMQLHTPSPTPTRCPAASYWDWPKTLHCIPPNTFRITYFLWLM